eukprot:CAMPEP_0114511292 /NCGR_PEP_ID=MMETSP0109-20121206/14271_1 /TAXON_ID=29199 /ORGANISM="Chlorarachnion reptans, Strain CCCM449" /LENGTH=97 /DNA_ID=CAMNT_0001690713 /DNA_START=228 /DNA_END=521 /DNA_ORIENTATION=+
MSIEDLELKIKKILVEASTKLEGSDDPFGSPNTRFQILKETVVLTGVEIPNSDLSTLYSSEAVVDYVWGRLQNEKEETETETDSKPKLELPSNLKFE